MAIVQCQNNHYYDDKRNDSCPYCEKLGNEWPAVQDFNEQMTSYGGLINDDDAVLTEGYGEFVENYEKTIGIFVDETQNLLTVGWLVCMSGVEKGKTHVIHAGRNFAGTSLDMDIVLAEDENVKPDKHFSVVYDPMSVEFYIVSGEGHTYVNGNAVTKELKITDGDIVKVGENEYTFVPFCKEGRVWD